MELTKDHSIMLDPERESFRLEKNSKGRTWEIKIIVDNTKTDEENIARLVKLDSMLEKQYGSPIA